MVRSRLVTHDTPVNLIPKDKWDSYQEPQVPVYDVSPKFNHLTLILIC